MTSGSPKKREGITLRSILVDSSGILALLNKNDMAHERMVKAVRGLADSNVRLFMTNFLIAETHTLIGTKLTWDAARKWLSALRWDIEGIRLEDEQKARRIIFAHADKTYSYVDATSFAVMKRLNVKTAVTLDDHFRQFGFEALPV